MEKSLSNQKNRIAIIIFYIAFLMEILIRCLNSAGIVIPYRGRLLQLAALLFGVKIILTHYSKKEWGIIIVAVILSIIPVFVIRETLWLQIAMMLIASKDVSREKSFKIYFCILGISMLLMVIFSACGVIDNFVQVKDFDRGGVETRYCFGFNHPNVFYSNIILLLSIGLIVFWEKMRVWEYAILMLVNIILFSFSKSRNGFIVATLLLVGSAIVKSFPAIMKKRMIYYLGYLAIGLCVLVSWGVLLVDHPFIGKIDSMLTGRINLAKVYAPIDTWTLWPNTIDRYVIDMGFVKLMASWGIIIGLVYIFLIFLDYWYLYKKGNDICIIVLLMYTVFTVIEAHALSMYFVGNVMFLLMIGWGKDSKNVSKEKSDTGTVSMCN